MNIQKKEYADLVQLAPPTKYMWTIVNFAQAWNTWVKALEKSLSPAKMTVSQITALQALFYNKRPMSPTEISKVLPIDTHSISPLVDKLHKRKLVTRRRSKSDRRSIEVELTRQGIELLKSLSPNINEVLEVVFGNLNQKELDELVKLSHVISYNAADYVGANKKRMDENAKILSGMLEGKTAAKKSTRSKSR
ncbi:MAG: MarR family transcriptional regulator [Dehalococcoidia bacterium]|jgi:DNA-binding MarR family transcriptional regulator